jgi:membrane protease YdiL (CAAX protease family)
MENEPPKLASDPGLTSLLHDSIPPVLPPEPVSPPIVTPASDVWGFWATLGLGFAIIVAMIMGQAVGMFIFAILRVAQGQKLDGADLESNGLMVSIATLVALPVTVGFCWLFAWLKVRKRAVEYLALKRAGWRSYIGGFVGLGIIMLTWMGMTRVFDIPTIPPFVIEAYRTAEVYPLLWLAIIIAAPIMEETLFRGFFFQGLSRSRVGAVGAILFPSLFWALMHVQYGVHEIMLILLFGIMLGVLRLKSGSILPGMLIHAVSNLASTIEVALFLGSEGL